MSVTGLKGFQLSVQQTRLWALQGGSQAYRGLWVLRLDGALKVATFLRAIRELVSRHTILRTSFHLLADMEVPLQVIKEAEIHCPLVDLSELSAADQSARIEQCFTGLLEEALDMQRPALSAGCLRLSSHVHHLLLRLPALCADETTMSEISVELGRCYEALLRHETLPDDPLQYVDVAAWQDDLLLEEESRQQHQLWQRIDLERLHALQLNQVHISDPSPEAFAPLSLGVDLQGRLIEKLRDLAARHQSTVEVCLLACWRAALWRFIDDAHLIVGVACHGRPHEELEHAPGLYTRFVPLETGLSDELPFDQALALLQGDLQRACEEQLYFCWPTHAKQERDRAGSFPICFDYHRWPLPLLAGQVQFSLLRRFSCIEPFLFRLSILHTRDQMHLEVLYDPARCSEAPARRLLLMVHTILQWVVEQPHTPFGRLPLCSQLEQEYLCNAFRGPGSPPSGPLLHQLFEDQAARFPGRLAVIAGTDQLTYGELNSRANQLAHLLRRLGVGPDVLVGLDLPRSGAMLVCLLGVLKAGGAYVPFDPANPSERLAYQLRDARVRLLLTGHESGSRLPAWHGQILEFEALQADLARESEANLKTLNTP